MSGHDTWMPLYPADYLAATSHLTGAESGAYLHLLMAAWTRGGSLPNDDSILARLCRLAPDEWAAVRPAVAEFWTIAGGRWQQRRLTAELERAAAVHERRGAAGGMGGRPKGEEKPGLSPALSKLKPGPTQPQPQPQEASSLTTFGKKSKTLVAASPLPPWLPADVWEEWRRHRGGKLTARAVELQLATLEKLRTKGHDPTRVIEQSIERGWRGLFEIKADGAPKATPKQASRDQVAGGIWQEQPNDRHDDRTIDGTAERVA